MKVNGNYVLMSHFRSLDLLRQWCSVIAMTQVRRVTGISLRGQVLDYQEQSEPYRFWERMERKQEMGNG
jgi:hypothetical protein